MGMRPEIPDLLLGEAALPEVVLEEALLTSEGQVDKRGQWPCVGEIGGFHDSCCHEGDPVLEKYVVLFEVDVEDLFRQAAVPQLLHEGMADRLVPKVADALF